MRNSGCIQDGQSLVNRLVRGSRRIILDDNILEPLIALITKVKIINPNLEKFKVHNAMGWVKQQEQHEVD